ncbi:Stk1 family PASTA domain-containing Ser/Thr kinase [Streptomyces sp. TP-A0874]|uniref:Stk1 family PASTA domain-containing Ser/Thr kinase n=1 Tax=Streptomyces sp. TP-A0874 TaxID=549819 RepID=UPI000852F614|nr:Stk1 family PASTA domain-containing Ser/Thr kinase [Streptomyces sp. TP-A0874]
MEEPRRLGGRYELGSVLGRGGMAEVYLAHDTRLGRTVAVKTLRVDLARDPSFQARFRREAQSAASLNHPAIVAVYDTGEDYVDGVSIPYIVMEYVDGSTLRELLHSGRKLLPERSLEMTVGVLQALEYSHRAGIVHRDIKPANVMLTRSGHVKVMDFGIARAMGDAGMTMTQTAAVIGTAQYLSPEQAKGEQVDARSDLYSTGCLLYELLTVRPPFVGDSPVAVAYQHVREEPQPPSTFDPEISPDMDAIVLKALVKDPDYRYQSADEMRADIEAALEGRPVAAAEFAGVGYGGYGDDQPTTALRATDPGGQTSMLPPLREDDGGFGYDERPDRRRGGGRKSSTSTVLLVVAGLLVLIGAVFIGRELFGSVSADNDVPVPSLVGLDFDEASRKAENIDLKLVKAGSETCESGEKNTVTKQDPAKETEVPKGSEVDVTLCSGPNLVKIPDVKGLPLDEAEAKLKKEGFEKISTKQVTSEDHEPGTVVEQDPAAESERAKDTEITLSVAQAPEETLVPDVTNKPLDQAKQQLEALGLQVATQDQPNNDVPENTVIAQSPGGNEKVKPNSTITLTIAKPVEKFQMPDVKGQKLEDAKRILTEAGLSVGNVTGPQDGNARVLATSPDAGAEVSKGDQVTIVTAPSTGNPHGDDGGFFGGPGGRRG